MKRSGCLLLLFLSSTALADEPARESESGYAPQHWNMSLGELTPTPEMWFYDQEMRLYDNPKHMVRKKAEFSAQQRLRRIESRRWFGYSNARPRMSPDPMYGTGSPRWGSNTGDPWLWRGVSVPPSYQATPYSQSSAYRR